MGSRRVRRHSHPAIDPPLGGPAAVSVNFARDPGALRKREFLAGTDQPRSLITANQFINHTLHP